MPERTAEATVEIAMPLLLPEITDERDRCVEMLQNRLCNQKGVVRTHLEHEHNPVDLCVHFDPDLISLSAVQRLAEQTGSELTNRYRHKTWPFSGLNNADSAFAVTEALEALPGMVHAHVNYAAGLIFVAYEGEKLDAAQIEARLEDFGVQRVKARPQAAAEKRRHLGAPPFMPSWLQERWALVLTALSGLFLAAGWLAGWAGAPQAALVFFLLAYVAGGYDIAVHAIPGLLRGQFDTDVLMLAAAGGAAILGEWAEGAFLLFLFSLGHAGEHYALDRARSAVNALGELLPQTAHVRRGGQVVEQPLEALAVGDVVLVRPGDRFPVDGVVAAGESAVDQSPITGESVPVDKRPGMDVFAGTINQDAALDVRMTRAVADATLNRVLALVAEAQSAQSPTQRFTESFTRRFVPAVLILTFLTAVIPPLAGWMAFETSFYRAMLLLIAASPCALAIGTPAAVLSGIAQAARNGVLIKGGVHLENLGALQVVAFDKTGTLTHGRFEVLDLYVLNGVSADEMLQLAAALEQQSNHPLAQAISRRALADGLTPPAAHGVQNLPGRGVTGQAAGETVHVLALEAFEQDFGPVERAVSSAAAKMEAGGRTVVAIARGGALMGLIGLADAPRPGGREALGRLKALGIKHLVMLTGDNAEVAAQIGQDAGVTDVRAELLPEDKLAAVRDLQREYGPAAMVGDGVNDAPALAAATVGIAMGGMGTAVALETADVALMADDLGKLPFAVGLSRAGRAIIRQNLALALGVIGLLIATAVTGLIELSWAVALHEGSTLLVVLNALRLLNYKAEY